VIHAGDARRFLMRHLAHLLEMLPAAAQRRMAGSVHRFKQESMHGSQVDSRDHPELRSAVATALIDNWMP
jgi:hypothetical protein